MSEGEIVLLLLHNFSVWDFASIIVQKGRLFFGQTSSCLHLSSLVSRPFEEEKKGPGGD